VAKFTKKEMDGIEYLGFNPNSDSEYIADAAKGYSFDTEYGLYGFWTDDTKKMLIENLKGTIVYHDNGDTNNNNVTNVLTGEHYTL
tara:strand:+ start:265 stop:522 length:258 start_codon:yes stop_codon:yes gene_type:complete